MGGIRHVGIRARDLARSRRFYEEGLGLTFLGDRPSGAIDLADVHVNLTLIPYRGPKRPPFVEGTEFIHIGFLVEDLAATYRQLLEIGGAIVRDDVKQRLSYESSRPPSRSFKVLDPDGNVIDVTEQSTEWPRLAEPPRRVDAV